MTTDELNDALDALQAAAAHDETRRPGLIEVSVDDWIQRLAEMQTKAENHRGRHSDSRHHRRRQRQGGHAPTEPR